MGIAEMNLVLLLGQLGLSWDFQRERLFPIGTLYDPFVMRALEGIVYSTYSGLAVRPRRHAVRNLARRARAARTSRSHAGDRDRDARRSRTPSRATRASSSGCCSTRSRGMQEPDGRGALPAPLDDARSTRRPSRAAADRVGEERLRGGRRRRRLPPARARRPADDRVLARRAAARSCPRRSRAAELLADEEGVEATVLCLSSPDRLYRDWQARRTAPLRRRAGQRPSHLERAARARTSAGCPSSR